MRVANRGELSYPYIAILDNVPLTIFGSRVCCVAPPGGPRQFRPLATPQNAHSTEHEEARGMRAFFLPALNNPASLTQTRSRATRGHAHGGLSSNLAGLQKPVKLASAYAQPSRAELQNRDFAALTYAFKRCNRDIGSGGAMRQAQDRIEPEPAG